MRVDPTLPGIFGILGAAGIAIPDFSSSEKKAAHMTLAVF
jgi:hypothetical protein